MKSLDPPIERFFSSPFYRCLQTILPTVEALAVTTDDPETKKIRAENGIGEWYGKARFDHPSPADRTLLKKLFPRLDEKYDPIVRPSTDGESIDELHDRVAYALHRIIEFSDKEGVKAIAICTHGATLIAIGRKSQFRGGLFPIWLCFGFRLSSNVQQLLKHPTLGSN